MAQNNQPEFLYGTTAKQPVLPVEGEIFVLRKLLPMTAAYDFNVHVMDFKPGEYLNVKEVHYNQHGLLLVQVWCTAPVPSACANATMLSVLPVEDVIC